MTKPLCIYHGGCDDGFGAAWAVRRAFGFNVEFYPGVYQNKPPDVTDSSSGGAGAGLMVAVASDDLVGW